MPRSWGGLTIQRLLSEGDPASAIVQAAVKENADLIMMPSHGFTFEQFLLGSVTAKVLHRAECPVWTGAHIEKSLALPFVIRNVLCAVDLGPRSDQATLWTAQIASKFNARLTLAHVTAGVELWGPDGWHVDQGWKDALERCHAARREAGARHRHQGGSIDRQWRCAKGAEPSCETDECGFAGDGVLPVWR